MKYLFIYLFLFSYQVVLASPIAEFKGVKSSTQEKATEMTSSADTAISKSEFCCEREVQQGNAHDLSPQEINNLINGSSSKKPATPKDSGQR